MKRIISIILIIAIGVAAIGCSGAQPPAAQQTAEPPAAAQPEGLPDPTETPAEPSEQEPMMGLPNPMVQYEDLQALQQEIGTFVTIPDQSADAEFFLIDKTLAHITFTYEGIPYVLRLKKTTALEDISGVYADMTTVSEEEWGEVRYRLLYIEGEIGLSQWYDEAAGYSYSIFMEHDASAEALSAITQSIIPVG